MLRKRLYHIDLLRFLAALYVLFYHYCFRGYSKDNLSLVRFEPLEELSKYGYLGVDLFFIISGFVILMTALNSNLTKFMISRFSRLYPAYWICLLITLIVLFFWGAPERLLSTKEILLNLTMFHGFFGIPHVDGVYWSLIIELKFYILIGVILFFNLIKYIRVFAIALLGIAALQLVVPFGKAYFPLKLLYFITFPQWSSYFVAGMFFFLIYKEGFKWKYFVFLICCYLISLQFAFVKVDHLNEAYVHHFSYLTVSFFITTFYTLFYLISVEKLHFLNKKYFLTLGAITYPLYLIHQNIGYTILNQFSPYVNKWILLVSLILLMMVLSLLIHKVIEKPLGSYFRNKLKESRFVLHFQSKLNTIYTKA
ncbi:acyltransferase family protein [Flagellimonas profundi]|uniref:Acyltransferase n=1 Tax=Flagellimonas profundi TaxID=2915620 RepID=A0ABS3FBJ5_9FLAO|nr:acyltransferase [Allomuricauda profundi]MBO0340535.1 acyltransferase [Allomuricauda profundi]